MQNKIFKISKKKRIELDFANLLKFISKIQSIFCLNIENSKYLNFYVPGIIFELSKIWTLENFNFQMILNFKYSTFANVLKGLLEIFIVWFKKKKKIWKLWLF